MLQHLFTPETNALIGEKITLADLVLYSLITEFFTDTESAYQATENLPRIRGCVDNVAGNNEIKKWLATRPKTDF